MSNQQQPDQNSRPPRPTIGLRSLTSDDLPFRTGPNGSFELPPLPSQPPQPPQPKYPGIEPEVPRIPPVIGLPSQTPLGVASNNPATQDLGGSTLTQSGGDASSASEDQPGDMVLIQGYQETKVYKLTEQPIPGVNAQNSPLPSKDNVRWTDAEIEALRQVFSRDSIERMTVEGVESRFEALTQTRKSYGAMYMKWCKLHKA